MTTHRIHGNAVCCAERHRACGVRGTRRRNAFTVVEMLVTMVILMIIVAAFARIFQRTTASWESGMRTVETAIAGRAALNLIVRDIERGVVDPVLVDELFDIANEPGAKIQILSLSQKSPYRVQLLKYSLEDGKLLRATRDPIIAGGSPPPWKDPSTVIENVASVSFDAYMGGGGDTDLPQYVKIRLRLSNRYDPGSQHYQDFVGRAFPVHTQRYPQTE